jgi:hypothetical protein
MFWIRGALRDRVFEASCPFLSIGILLAGGVRGKRGERRVVAYSVTSLGTGSTSDRKELRLIVHGS